MRARGNKYIASMPWHYNSDHNVDEQWKEFQDCMLNATKKFIPMHRTDGKKRKSWVDSKSLVL